MTLDEHLAAIYLAEQRNAAGLGTAKQRLQAEMLLDDALMLQVRQSVSDLAAVRAARPQDYLTGKKLAYLQEALNGVQ